MNQLYLYGAGGNITSKTTYSLVENEEKQNITTVDYGYSDSNWKDKLTSYDGETITYDAIGNPLNWRNGETRLSWKNGRQLTGYSTGRAGGSRGYVYNDEGLRTQKVHGASGNINYFYNGSNLVTEEHYGDQKNFYYDESGNLIGCRIDGADYYYVKNLQNDIIGILDKDGNEVVSYTYDAWGKQLSVTGTKAQTIGEKNPFRYRGYYYDFESGFYYLNSRYYDPAVGRFINADTTDVLDVDQDSLLENNLFAYCLNNPVNMHDPGGYVAANIIGGAVGGVAGVALGVILAKQLKFAGWKKAALISAATVGGVALGAFLGPYVAKLGTKVAMRYGIKTAAKVAYKSIAKISSFRMRTHINVSKHLWGKVLKNATDKGVENLINQAVKKGTLKITNGISRYTYKYHKEIITVTGKVIDGVFNISDAWVNKR